MDLMTAISSVPGIGPALPYVAALVTVCAALAPLLPPPTASRAYAGLYRTVNFVAFNMGHARNATAPEPATKAGGV